MEILSISILNSDNNSHYIAAVADKDKDTTSYYDVTESTRTAYTDADGKELEAVPTVVDDTTLKVGDKTYKKDETERQVLSAKGRWHS